ncbi:hypothetical protein GQ54DRAFT_61524 [Martensiomyces pterosporus]|nr:hypothetical protein GQ54DRAFT_61524 [Martensiomyces pterosporus]
MVSLFFLSATRSLIAPVFVFALGSQNKSADRCASTQQSARRHGQRPHKRKTRKPRRTSNACFLLSRHSPAPAGMQNHERKNTCPFHGLTDTIPHGVPENTAKAWLGVETMELPSIEDKGESHTHKLSRHSPNPSHFDSRLSPLGSTPAAAMAVAAGAIHGRGFLLCLSRTASQLESCLSSTPMRCAALP